MSLRSISYRQLATSVTCALALAGPAPANFTETLNNIPGLISHWSLNEASGSTVADSVTTDSIDGDNPGTFGAGATLGAAGPAGIGFSPSNTAMEFTGTTTQGIVVNPNANFASLTEVSLGMWFRITDADESKQYYLGGYAESSGSDRYGFAINHYNGPTTGLRALARVNDPGDPSTIVEVSTPGAVAGPYRDNTWHYALMTVGPNTGGRKVTSIYIDGALEFTRTGAANSSTYEIIPRDSLAFGVDPGALDRAIIGQMDEISIFNRALEADEVMDLYLSAFEPLVSPELLGDYNDDGIVNLADYTVWRDNLGAPAGTLPNDADDGVIGETQYATWKANFGMTNEPELATSVAIPEPSSVCILLAAAGAAVYWRRRLVV